MLGVPDPALSLNSVGFRNDLTTMRFFVRGTTIWDVAFRSSQATDTLSVNPVHALPSPKQPVLVGFCHEFLDVRSLGKVFDSQPSFYASSEAIDIQSPFISG